jgi:hypothetical protein
MLDVIELFGERTTRDELGLGSVRDAFADMLFPGTSTIQTRARYFLFIPWMYLQLEDKRIPSADIARRARKLETGLMAAIESSDDSGGLVGRRAKGDVQRLASSVYWQGLLVWGIRQFSGSQDEYDRSLDLFYRLRQSRHHSSHEFDGESMAEPEGSNWHVSLPPAPDDFPHVASFSLQHDEAEYLRERILTHCDGSMLAHLLRERIPVAEISFAWELADAVPPMLRERLSHGQNFSEVMHGAQLLYNLMLAEKCDRQDKREEYEESLKTWWRRVELRQAELNTWSRQRFWQVVAIGNPRVSARAKAFIDRWVELVRHAGHQSDVVESAAARQLVDHREQQLKGSLARLHSQRAQELWGGAAGIQQLDLRWNKSRGLIVDILNGLERSPDA